MVGVMSEGRFAGVDWASDEHAVRVVDGRRWSAIDQPTISRENRSWTLG
jgi:hypothetical protein